MLTPWFFLTTDFFSLQEDVGAYDILSNHCQCNWSNLPPAPARLAISAAEQRRLSTPGPDHSSDESDGEKSNNLHGAKIIVTREVKDNTLGYWQGGWKIIALRSKAEYEYHIACNHFFPTRNNDLHDAALIITRQITNAVAEGIVLDNSEPFFF